MSPLPANPFIAGVNIIPASGEFVYDTIAWSGRAPGASSFTPINTYFAPGGAKTDFEFSLDQLQQTLPNCGFVALVVQWMGNSLDLSACKIYPSTTYWQGAAIGGFQSAAGGSDSWRVSDLSLADCNSGLLPISRPDGVNASYGGTCSDQSVVRAIQAIKARGLKVCLYLMMNMDVPGQPWRGTCSYYPDLSATATSLVEGFFGSATPAMFSRDPANLTVHYSGSRFDFTYRRFVLHYANLAALAGGVNLFTIGSELCGIETIRGPTWTPSGQIDANGHAFWEYPAIACLQNLIDDSRSVFDAAGLAKNIASRQNLITYSPDWTTWMGAQHAGVTGVFPHLDPLYAMTNCDLVSFDNYLPLTDWTTGGGGLDAQNWQAPLTMAWPNIAPATMGLGLTSSPDIHDIGYLQFGLERGEKCDFWYGDYESSTTIDPNGSGQYVTSPQGDRRAQSRNRYYPGQELFAFKKFRWWWNNRHRAVYDANDGLGTIPRGNFTAWEAQSKSIMFMEYGFASINRDTNEENVFFNPGTVPGGTPFWCEWQGVDGGGLAPRPDELLQYAGHQAWHQYWFAGGNNVTSSSGVQMIAADMMFAWNWDARPFPTFPLRLDVWSDGVDWRSGMWLAGKGPALAAPVTDAAPGSGTYAAFPSLNGQSWSVKYLPRFSTRALARVSGRETRAARMTAPLYDVELSFGVLRDAPAYAELQDVIGFIAAHAGQATPFLLPPPSDLATITGAALGVGDGAQRVFILRRIVSSFSEATQALIGSPTVYQDGAVLASSAYAVSILPATITFVMAPTAGAVLTVDFSPAHLARFTNDAEELEQFMSGFWNKKLKLETVRA